MVYICFETLAERKLELESGGLWSWRAADWMVGCGLLELFLFSRCRAQGFSSWRSLTITQAQSACTSPRLSHTFGLLWIWIRAVSTSRGTAWMLSILFGISSAKLLHCVLILSQVLLARTECSQIRWQDVNISRFYQLGLHCSHISGIPNSHQNGLLSFSCIQRVSPYSCKPCSFHKPVYGCKKHVAKFNTAVTSALD